MTKVRLCVILCVDIIIIINTCTVIKQCALEQDLSLWKAGDMTEVGEKGLTLRCDLFYPLKGNYSLITVLAEI